MNGRKLQAPSATNPIIGENAIDTVHNAACALEYLSQCSLREGTDGALDETLDFGKFLLEQSIVEALNAAKQQLVTQSRQVDAQLDAARTAAHQDSGCTESAVAELDDGSDDGKQRGAAPNVS